MKNIKNAILLSLASSLLAQPVFSDVLGVYAGAGAWQGEFDGEIGTDDVPLTTEELGFDKETNTFFFVAFEHPIPVLPNVRVAMNSLETSGVTDLTRDLPVAIDSGFQVPVGATLTSDIDLDFIDYTLYYELLDNYVSFDLGITARQLDGSATFSYEVSNEGGTVSETTEEDLDVVLPMLYTKVQLDLPLSGWYFGGQANIISYDDNSLSDIEAKIGYMTSGLGLDVGFDLGYRQLSLETDPTDEDLVADFTIDGPFASLIVHF